MSLTTRSFAPPVPAPDDRIAVALERIAAALEALVLKKP